DGIETALDIDTAISLAPAAHVVVYQGPNSGSGPYDTYAAILSAVPRAQVISTSWGECEPDLATTYLQAVATLYQEAAVQGQTIVAASGDDGIEDCYIPSGGSEQDLIATDDPSSQPFVTGVGGTSLPSITRTPPEAVWDDLAGASGGGDSSFWPMPSYQTGANPTLGVINGNSSPAGCTTFCHRQTPDVSADADPSTGYLIYWHGDGTPTLTSAWKGE